MPFILYEGKIRYEKEKGWRGLQIKAAIEEAARELFSRGMSALIGRG